MNEETIEVKVNTNDSSAEIRPSMVNFGVVEVPLPRKDFIVGAASQITYQEVLPSGDWSQLLPPDERQRNVRFDTMGCVSFSANNALESQLNMIYKTLPAPHRAFLEQYKVNGHINLSDRFLAKMSNTQRYGNYASKVADSVRNFGSVPESMWGWSDNDNWGTFYAEIPEEVKAQGQEFRRYFEVKYEWVHTKSQAPDIEKLRKHLKHAPLQVLLKTCSGWRSKNPVPWCNTTDVNHAVLLTGIRSDGMYEIFDHYAPYRKTLAADYLIPWALKLVIIPKKTMFTLFRDSGNTDEIYATLGTAKHHVANKYTLVRGNEDKLWDWSPQNDAEVSMELTQLPEGAEINLTPPDSEV